MSAVAPFAAEVRRAVENGPYAVVDESPHGFAMHIDVVDARWWSVFYRNGLRETWRWEVQVAPDGTTYTVNNRAATVEWQSGVDAAGGAPQPTLRFASSIQSGSSVSISSRKTFGIDDRGQFGKVVDYSFDSREGRDIIDGVAQRLGLRKALGSQARIGLIIALVAVGGAILSGAVLAVLLVVLL